MPTDEEHVRMWLGTLRTMAEQADGLPTALSDRLRRRACDLAVDELTRVGWLLPHSLTVALAAYAEHPGLGQHADALLAKLGGEARPRPSRRREIARLVDVIGGTCGARGCTEDATHVISWPKPLAGLKRGVVRALRCRAHAMAYAIEHGIKNAVEVLQ